MGLIFFHLRQVQDHPFMIETFSYLTLLLIPLLAYLIRQHVIKRPRLKLPPGPLGLPVIGNMHQLGNLPHRSLGLLSKKYGPLMSLQLGQIPTFVVSSADMAKEFMKTHDLTFCSKSSLIAMRKLSYGCLDMAFAPYGEYWRQIRKITTIELLTTKRVQSFAPIREEEVGIFLRMISKSSSSGAVNLSNLIFCLVNNITCREVFGKRFSEDGECGRSKFHELVSDLSVLFGSFCAGDFLPYMEWLNVITGLKSRMNKCFLEMEAFFEEILEECRRNQLLKLERNDFVSVLLQHQKDSTLGIPLTNDHIKAVLMDLFFAGTDTAATCIEWGMTELMRNPRVMMKAQNEVRSIIGKKEKVEESDLQNFQFLKLVVKEILRFHPPAPLLVPRECMKECMINGYDIPKKARVFINIWEISRDPKYWENPNEFVPERFKDSTIDYKGQDFQFLPFGGGRRICPGITSGAIKVELVLANLLHVFNWDFPKEMTKEDLDVTETFGVVVSKRTPLLLLATLKNKN